MTTAALYPLLSDFINLCHAVFQRSSDIESTYFGSMICYIIMAALAFVIKVAPKEDYIN